MRKKKSLDAGLQVTLQFGEKRTVKEAFVRKMYRDGTQQTQLGDRGSGER